MSDFISVKKGNIRPFILFCVDLANSENELEVHNIVNVALQKEVFTVNASERVGEKSEINTEIARLFFVSQMERFRPVVKELAEKRQNKSPFGMAISPGFANVFIHGDTTAEKIQSDMSVLDGGAVVFDPAGVLDATEEEGFFSISFLFTLFFENLLRLAAAKRAPFLDLPLGICKECGNVFFGRQSNQEFCSQDHGQLWRSREAYRSQKNRQE